MATLGTNIRKAGEGNTKAEKKNGFKDKHVYVSMCVCIRNGNGAGRPDCGGEKNKQIFKNQNCISCLREINMRNLQEIKNNHVAYL